MHKSHDQQPDEVSAAASRTSSTGSEPGVSHEDSGDGIKHIGEKPSGANRVTPTTLRRATGPRSDLGKRRSSRNALKHGIFSAAVLPGLESRKDYEELVRQLRADSQPQGSVEELLVQKLATIIWRQRRVLAAEAAEITKSIEFGDHEKLALQALEIEDRIESGETNNGMVRYFKNPVLMDRSLQLLRGCRERVAQRGYDAYFDGQILRKLYGRLRAEEMPADLQHRLKDIVANPRTEVSNNGHDQPQAGSEEKIKAAIELVDRKIEWVEHATELTEDLGSRRRRYDKQASLVPASETVERLMRYEAHLSREFARTLNQLLELQRLRNGGAMLPPVKLQLS